jgi:hypothetical protein
MRFAEPCVWGVALAVCLSAFALGSSADASINEISPQFALTQNSDYDRNPSIHFDGQDYWLFYTKADQDTPAIRGLGGYDPDQDAYVVYYKSSPTIEGLTAAAENVVPPSDTARPADFWQRCATGFADTSGSILVIASSGHAGPNDRFYRYSYDGATWSGPVEILHTDTLSFDGGHVHGHYDGSSVYIVWEDGAGNSSFSRSDDFGLTWSSPVLISSDNMPKMTIMSGQMFVVSIEDGTGDIEVHVSSDTGATWSPHSTAVSGAGLYDPCIFNDENNLYVVSAPYDAGDDRQYLIQTVYSGSWSAAKSISFGGYEGAYWWEYWPVGYHDGSHPYIFFTTETGSPSFSDAEIAYARMDWDLGKNHYFYIGNGIAESISGDTLNVLAGDYEEQLTVDGKMLTMNGAGAGLTNVLAPAILDVSFTTSAANRCVISAIDGGDLAVNDITIDGRGNGNGNSRFTGAGAHNSALTLSDCEVLDVRNTPLASAQHGVAVYAVNDDGTDRSVTISGCTVSGYQKNGITLNGANVVADINGTTVTGAGPISIIAQNGIQLGFGATGSITGSTVEDNAYTEGTYSGAGVLLWETAAVDVSNNIAISENEIGIRFVDLTAPSTCDSNYVTATGALGTGAFWGVVIDPASGTPIDADPYDPDMGGGGGEKSVTEVSMDGNVLESDCTPSGYGAAVWALTGTNVNATITNNIFDGWDFGLVAMDDGSATPTAVVHDNIFRNNCGFGFYNETSTDLTVYQNEFYLNGVNARDDASASNYWDNGSIGNYWDDYYGPGSYFLPGDAGSEDRYPIAPIVYVDPVYDSIQSGETAYMNVVYDGDAVSQELASYDINLTFDTTYVTGSTDSVFEGAFLSDIGPTDFNVILSAPGSFDVSCQITSGDSGATGTGTLFTVALTGRMTRGISPLDIVDVTLRDPLDEVLPSTRADGEVEVKIDAPDEPEIVAEPAHTEGTSNSIAWTDESTSGAVAYLAQCDDDSAFGSPFHVTGWIDSTDYNFTGLGDGIEFFYRVRAKDSLSRSSDWSPLVSSTQDSEPPVTSVINLEDCYNDTIIDIEFSAYDPGIGVDSVDFYYSANGTLYVKYGTYTSSPVSFDMSTVGGAGTYYFYTVGTDGFGHVEPVPGVPDDSTTFDFTPPTTPSVIMSDQTSGNITFTNSPTVDVDLFGDEEAVAWIIVDYDPYQPDEDDPRWSSEKPTEFTFINSLNGNKSCHVWIKDCAGNVNTNICGDTIILDTVAPADATLTMTDPVTGSEDYTNSMTVDADVWEEWGVWKYILSETQDTQPAELSPLWESEPTSYTFDTSTNEVKTVYVWVKDRAGNVCEGLSFDEIELDTLRPAAVTGFAAAPGHNVITLSWDVPVAKASPIVSTTIRKLAWGDYPTYTGPGPGYPADPSSGDLVATVAYPETSFVDTISAGAAGRDIYLYTAFARDSASNYSPAGMTAQAQAVSYHLGDFDSSYDGYVDFEDLVVFSDCYGSSPPLNLECDIGPTSSGGITGVPVPDDSINFDDLMIFSMNFESVSPAKRVLGGLLDLADAGTKSGLPEVPSTESADETVALLASIMCDFNDERGRAFVEIDGNNGSLKGMSIDLSYDPSVVAPVTCNAGEVFAKTQAPHFMHDSGSAGELTIDLAVLGRGLGVDANGAFAEIVFERLADQDPSIRIVAIDARSIENEPMPIRIERTRPGIRDVTVAELTVYQNYPNPFGPKTLIPFALPADQDAAVEIYNAAGQLVATVADGAFGRGSNIAAWDGSDSRGRPVASGLYFYKVTAGRETVTRRMLLLR